GLARSARESLPLLPLKNTVLFPHLMLPLTVGRAASVAAAKAALETESQEIVLVAQRDADVDEPQQDDLYTIGTKAVIKRVVQSRDDVMEVFVAGTERVVLVKLDYDQGGYTGARVRAYPLPQDTGPEVEALHRAVMELAVKAISLVQTQTPIDLKGMLAATDDPVRLVYLIASMLNLDLQKAQAVLEAPTALDALRLIHTYLSY